MSREEGEDIHDHKGSRLSSPAKEPPDPRRDSEGVSEGVSEGFLKGSRACQPKDP